MRILVLGGTGLLGRAVVDDAVARGHQVASLSRGESGAPRAQVTALYGAREDAAAMRAAVREARPHAVVDCSCLTVRAAELAAELLADVHSYVLVSSLSAYRNWPRAVLADEQAELWPPAADDEPLPSVDGVPSAVVTYGAMKSAAEALLAAAAGHLMVVRPGLIVGPGDTSGRLTSWLQRLSEDFEVVVPRRLDIPLQLVDSRDLGGWLVDCAERRLTGVANATGPQGSVTFGALIEACTAAIAQGGGVPATLRPVDDAVLAAAGIDWRQLPFWLPEDAAATAWRVGTARAQALGLTHRSITATIADTWAWMQGSEFFLPPADEGGPGLPSRLHAELLARDRGEAPPSPVSSLTEARAARTARRRAPEQPAPRQE